MPCWFSLKGFEHQLHLLVGFPCLPFVFSQMPFSHMHFNPDLIRILPRGAGCERRCLYFWTLRSLRGLLGPKTVPWCWKDPRGLTICGFFTLTCMFLFLSSNYSYIHVCPAHLAAVGSQSDVAQCGQPHPHVLQPHLSSGTAVSHILQTLSRPLNAGWQINSLFFVQNPCPCFTLTKTQRC